MSLARQKTNTVSHEMSMSHSSQPPPEGFSLGWCLQYSRLSGTLALERWSTKIHQGHVLMMRIQ